MEDIDIESTMQDISAYIQAQLGDVEGLDKDWPDNLWCKQLTESSEGLFQWAFTACHLIKGVGKARLSPPIQHRQIMSSKRSTGNALDELYLRVLRQNLADDDDMALASFKLIMGRILAARQPLSIVTLNLLCCTHDPDDVCWTVKYLGALLSGVGDRDIPVRPLHTSFRDFLIDSSRSKEFQVDVSSGHANLALACLQTMARELHFNISNFPSSYVCNDVIDTCIANHLSYSCQFWADHFKSMPLEQELLEEVNGFLSSRPLYWLEVLSVTKKISIASYAMTTAGDLAVVSPLSIYLSLCVLICG